jgi:hypothetical protein
MKVSKKETELLNLAKNSRIVFNMKQSEKNYLQSQKAVIDYINYINAHKNKTPNEKFQCVKNVFDRSIMPEKIPIVKPKEIVVLKTNVIKSDFLINLTNTIIKDFNWILYHGSINEFSIFGIILLLTLL